jgi:hypothetical protein
MRCSDASVECDAAADSAAPADGDDADIRTKKRGQDEAGSVVLLGLRADKTSHSMVVRTLSVLQKKYINYPSKGKR